MPLAANISKKSAKSGEDQYVQRAASAEVVSSTERERQLKGGLLWMEFLHAQDIIFIYGINTRCWTTNLYGGEDKHIQQKE